MNRDAPLDRRYLHHRRHVDEAKALRRIRATTADLAIWRRDKAFRDAESAAKVAPKARARSINPYELLHPEQAADLVRDRIAGAGIEVDRYGIRK